jgi:hydroxymethylpyrimidine pyrophosphatase-like HAD family hydrolase
MSSRKAAADALSGLVTDYDGTVAMGGQADESTLSALERLRMSGRRAILVTGRQLDDLLTVCPRLSVFDYVVAENGAVLYEPRTRQQTLLGQPRRCGFYGACGSLPAIRSALGRL